MPHNYIVKKKDTLPEIAYREGVSEKAIIDATIAANGKYKFYADIIRNPNTLMEGMTLTIPDKVGKEVHQSTGTKVAYSKTVPGKQYLRIQLDDENGIIAGIKLCIDSSKIDIEPITNYEIKGPKFVRSKTPLPPISKITKAYLELFLYSIKGIDEPYIKEKIELHIGDLDPIIDVDTYWKNSYQETDNKNAKMAVQKILVNLGYLIPGTRKIGDKKVEVRIDGVFGPFTEAAIASFQRDYKIDDAGEYGKINDNTLWKLVNSQSDLMMGPQTIKTKQQGSVTRNQPLFNNITQAKKHPAKVLPFSKYDEHTVHKYNTGKPPAEEIIDEDKIRRYPEQAFVAPCSESPGESSSQNVNRIGSLKNKFIFLDSGYWYQGSRNIGVIYGRHVYQCTYRNYPWFHESKVSRSDKSHLDYVFFKGVPNIEIETWAYAYWERKLNMIGVKFTSLSQICT